ncbi:hypothetical protein MNBD_GAMMA03-100 [hydrothermal vent metagenome]|uniref:Porin domain-containing protein n=1 Tax=hydrothermal vent metagenome TaxID=652676 RepID=A0A3B0W010_9ZZZZ
MKILKKTLLVSAITLATTTAMAVDVEISGFGTIGYSQNDEKDSVVNNVPSKGSWGHASLLGLQADVKITSALSATAQVKLSEDATIDEKMQMTLQMAFLGYQVTDALKVRVGRLRAPFYLDSEYLDVGYVKTTATAPYAVYGQAPFSNYNGVDVIFTHYTESDLEFQIQPYLGKEETEIDLRRAGGGGKLEANYLAGINASIAGDDWKVRAGYTIGEMNNPSYQENTFTEDFFLNDDVGSFLTVGANYDNGALLATVEFAKRSVEDAQAIADLTGAYVTLGYRLSDFTPYVTYQTQETDDKNRAAPTYVNSDFNALSLGFKYDFSKVAFKAEVTNFEFGKNGSLGYVNTLTKNVNSTLKSAKVLNLTLETVF